MIRPRLVALAAAGLLGLGFGGSFDLRVSRIRLGDHPAFVRVVLDVSGARLRDTRIESTDSVAEDGRVRVEMEDPRRVAAEVRAADAEGVQVRLLRESEHRLAAVVSSRKRRFKYVALRLLAGPDRVVIDLWKSAPPGPGAVVRRAPGGCLTIDRYAVGPRIAVVSGRESGIFEHMFVVRLRGAAGRIVASKPVTALDGRWRARLRYVVAATQPGTLEAYDGGAVDGAQGTCLAQVRVRLTPRGGTSRAPR